MNSSSLNKQIHDFFNLLCTSHHSCAITDDKGSLLFLKYQNLVDIGTLPNSAQSSNQYIKLRDKEILITNDPYGGASTLSSLNCIMGINTKKDKGYANLLFTLKLPFKPKLSLGDSIEEEGIRIPPTPIYSGGKTNESILEAISAHPMAPINFKWAVQNTVLELHNIHKNFFLLNSIYNFEWNKNFIKDYILSSKKIIARLFANFSQGEVTKELKIDSQTSIKLHLKIQGDKFFFDFSGSKASPLLNLTQAAALGVCVGATLSLLEKNILINQAVFEHFEVITPEGSMLQSKYPKPVYLGMTDGAAMIANHIIATFGIIDKHKVFSQGGISQCSIEFDFGDCHFFETLEPGSAASPQNEGVDGKSLWLRSHLHPSIEEIEKRFPISVNSFSFRHKSGGDGKKRGGHGILKSFTLQKDCILKWAIIELENRPMGCHGGQDAQQAEIHLHQSSGQRITLEAIGSKNLKAGDHIVIQSSGGGGYGKLESE